MLSQAVIASAHSIEIIALGEIIYAFGFTGLQILQQIVIADMTTLRYRRVHRHPTSEFSADGNVGGWYPPWCLLLSS